MPEFIQSTFEPQLREALKSQQFILRVALSVLPQIISATNSWNKNNFPDYFNRVDEVVPVSTSEPVEEETGQTLEQKAKAVGDTLELMAYKWDRATAQKYFLPMMQAVLGPKIDLSNYTPYTATGNIPEDSIIHRSGSASSKNIIIADPLAIVVPFNEVYDGHQFHLDVPAMIRHGKNRNAIAVNGSIEGSIEGDSRLPSYLKFYRETRTADVLRYVSAFTAAHVSALMTISTIAPALVDVMNTVAAYVPEDEDIGTTAPVQIDNAPITASDDDLE